MASEPTRNEVAKLEREASKLREKIVHYRDIAAEIDQKELDRRAREDEDEVELPYAEERVRLERAPKELEIVVKKLNAAQKAAADPISPDEFKKLSEIVSEWDDTLDDCTPLPRNAR